jgi:hypothetical protein
VSDFDEAIGSCSPADELLEFANLIQIFSLVNFFLNKFQLLKITLTVIVGQIQIKYSFDLFHWHLQYWNLI